MFNDLKADSRKASSQSSEGKQTRSAVPNCEYLTSQNPSPTEYHSFIHFPSLQNSTIAIMLRFDGKNPMDPGTYKQPAPSIQSMLELRAFCADVFDKLVRTTVNMEEEDIKCFLTLITHSPGFFARARAVIPELQAPDVESFHPIENRNLKVLLRATRSARGPPGKKWEWLPEELAWTQLAKDGMENVVQDLKNHGTGHEKKRSDASAQGTPSKHTLILGLTKYANSSCAQ